jgi:hypothetical protein
MGSIQLSQVDAVPYQPGHLDSLVPGQYDKANLDLLKKTPGWEGVATSIRYEERTLAVVGVAVVRREARIWAVGSDELRGSPVALCKMSQRSLLHLWNDLDIVRVEVEIAPENTVARRWAEWLGFEELTFDRMHYYGPLHSTG